MIVVLAVVVAGGLGLWLGLVLRRRGPAPVEAIDAAVAVLREQAAAERDAAVQAALQQAAVLNRQQLDAGLSAGQRELAARHEQAQARLDLVERRVRDELGRLGELVQQLGRHHAASLRGVEATLAAHAESTAALAGTTQSLREALASPKARGQWGERMAEDVLRLAGFVEHVNYEKQTAVEGSRALPDFTFTLPKGHVLYMDVKFPLAAYLRYLDAGTDAERAGYRADFVRDVRLRIRELAGRDYARQGTRPAVDYVLMFLPNETVAAFVHECDPGLVDEALGQRVVLCSPLTLFALLGVIRQAFDNFMVEQTSEEILAVLGAFEQQWQKFAASLDAVGKRLDSTQKAYDELAGTRRRALERPLARLSSLRTDRGIAADPAYAPDADVLAFDD
ncbi:MAG TPA: DNA recombination protein RmuC, partial [Acidimicrobiales bacterium]|nr:DNA recombination protein RmuC [Acidimicrobiales bacterium]